MRKCSVNDKNLILLEEIEKELLNNNNQNVHEKLPDFLKKTKKTLQRYNKILNLSDSQQFELLKLKEKLEKTNFQLKLLLDNANEGFLYVNGDLKIEPVYSKVVKNIFEYDISGKYIYDILFDKKNFYKEVLSEILSSDDLKAEVLLSLLPKEKEINGKIISIEYKKLENGSFMIVLRDITEKKYLQQQAKEEKEKLKMIVEVVSSIEQFLEIKFEYDEFVKSLDYYLKDMSAFKAKLHTFKGLFAQKHMKHAVNKIHFIETQIDADNTEYISALTYRELTEPVEKDIEEIKRILGDDFFEKFNYKFIEKKRLKKLYSKAQLLGTDVNILTELKELMYFNVYEFVKPFNSLINDLAEKYNKKIKFIYECDLFLPDIYKSFFMSLVHVFRNSVYHGIEDEYERMEKGKKTEGTVKFKAVRNGKEIIVSIKDDGRGIDTDKISKKAGRKVTDEQIAEYIFQEGFSTNEEADLVSGRGVGLYSVYEEVKKLNGSVFVKNKINDGAEFIIKLPFIEHEREELILDVLSEELKNLFRECRYITEKYEYNANYKCNKFSSSIYFKGDAENMIFIQCDSKGVYEIAKTVLYGNVDSSVIEEHKEDVLKEVVNILAGKAIKTLQDYNINADISTPFFYEKTFKAYKKDIVFSNFSISIGIKV
ncbi:hypothetical protein C3L23_05190 [Nautilia sp. PV-1]|nr:hypothetical protein C3L23_05190 [Nautilia sp. PV-1]